MEIALVYKKYNSNYIISTWMVRIETPENKHEQERKKLEPSSISDENIELLWKTVWHLLKS